MPTASSIKQQLFEPENVKRVIALLGRDPELSRQGLAKEICLCLGLKDGKGDLQTATTSKALRELEEEGLWTLPAPRSSTPRGWNATRLKQPVAAPADVPTVLEEIKGLCLIEVTDQAHLRLWNELIIGERERNSETDH